MAQVVIRPHRKIVTTWTPHLAYAVGLITTDGCLSTDGRHIDFTSKDESLVLTFRNCLKLNNVIGRKTSGFTGKRDYYRIQFGDVNFYNWLVKIGLSPHKSKTLGKLTVPREYFFDFLRGCFDGDGTIYSYWDPRWHSSFMFYIHFVSASLMHLEWLQAKITAYAGLRGRIQPSKRCYQLKYAKTESRILFQKMFYNRYVPCLERKFLKAQEIFAVEDEHNHARVT